MNATNKNILCSLLSLSVVAFSAQIAKAQNYENHEQCSNIAQQNWSECRAEAGGDATANMWGSGLGGAAVGGLLGATGAGAGAVPGAATGFIYGAAGAMGVELFQQGQCLYTYVSEISACSSYPESAFPQQSSPNQENIIELPPVHIYPEGDYRNYQNSF